MNVKGIDNKFSIIRNNRSKHVKKKITIFEGDYENYANKINIIKKHLILLRKGWDLKRKQGAPFPVSCNNNYKQN